jgi:hypothetical protein
MRMRFAASVLVMAVLGVAILVGVSFGQQRDASSDRPSEALKSFIRNYLNLGPGVPQETMRITVVSVKTEDKAGEEEVVYISGQGWCGVTGGCNMLIVELFQASFKVIGDVTIVQLPIYLLPSMENGHPDIGVWVAGGGGPDGNAAVLSFDGTSYPGNPSMPPARPVKGLEGKRIITTTKNSVPLYD